MTGGFMVFAVKVKMLWSEDIRLCLRGGVAREQT
jgi:hypothetical protein